MAQYEHALVTIRDLRRVISDMVLPGRVCPPERFEAIEAINRAIIEIKTAERLCTVADMLDGTRANQQSLITEALQQIDWYRSSLNFGKTPRPALSAELGAED